MISCSERFQGYSRGLLHMDLSSNRISVFPRDFFHSGVFSSLIWLNLQNNIIVDTTEICFNYFNNLRYLDLSRNKYFIYSAVLFTLYNTP